MFEILAMALVSGLVTWATIYFSVRQARKETDRAIQNQTLMSQAALEAASAETDRTLKAAEIANLRRVITDLAIEAQDLFDSADMKFPVKSGRGSAAIHELQKSNHPHALDAANWVDAFIVYTTTLNDMAKHLRQPIRAEILLMNRDFQSPGTTVARELSEWLDNPEAQGKNLAAQLETLKKDAHEMRTALIRQKLRDEPAEEAYDDSAPEDSLPPLDEPTQ